MHNRQNLSVGLNYSAQEVETLHAMEDSGTVSTKKKPTQKEQKAPSNIVNVAHSQKTITKKVGVKRKKPVSKEKKERNMGKVKKGAQMILHDMCFDSVLKTNE